MRILLIEDDPGIGEAVRDHLMAEGHAADWLATLADGEVALRAVPYDLLLLDLALPDGSGLDLLRRQRGMDAAVPVIILTARDRVSDRVTGLNAGADDYLVKPFDLGELSARVAAVARRAAGRHGAVLELGDLRVDRAARTVHRAGHIVDLTAREWSLWEALLHRPQAILSRAQLEERLYAFGDEVGSNTIEVHVSHLRRKLGTHAIVTVRGLGYRLGMA